MFIMRDSIRQSVVPMIPIVVNFAVEHVLHVDRLLFLSASQLPIQSLQSELMLITQLHVDGPTDEYYHNAKIGTFD